jgi:hypothetical protein
MDINRLYVFYTAAMFTALGETLLKEKWQDPGPINITTSCADIYTCVLWQYQRCEILKLPPAAMFTALGEMHTCIHAYIYVHT